MLNQICQTINYLYLVIYLCDTFWQLPSIVKYDWHLVRHQKTTNDYAIAKSRKNLFWNSILAIFVVVSWSF